jgi:predicted dehydrogenase
MDNAIRVGIIGAGGIARGYHVRSYQRCPNVQIVAACDISAAALEQLTALTGPLDTYTDYTDLLARDDLDLVSICTSNNMHYPAAMAAIARGVDIYCEKPLALNLAQAREMAAAATQAGLKTGVNFSHRRTPAARLAKEILDSGALGEVYAVSAIYAAGSPTFASRPGTWRNVKEIAGYGGMGDMGSHIIDMVLWLLQTEVTAVTGVTRTLTPERVNRDTGQPMRVTTEDQGMMLLTYANGATGYVCGSYAFTGRGYDQRIEIYGSQGGLMYDQQHAYELQVFMPDEHLARYVRSATGGTPDRPYHTILVPERHQGIHDGQPWARTSLMDFVDAYSATPFVWSPGFDEGVRVQEVLEAASLAEQRRAWVELPLP